MWRIAQGIKRFVIENPRPFIVKFRGDAHSSSIGDPLPTIVSGGRGEGREGGAAHGYGLATPHLTKFQENSLGQALDEPLDTVMAGATRFGVVTPSLVEMNHSNAPHGTDEPLGVVTTQANRFSLVTPIVAGVGGRAGQSEATPGDAPVGTITAKNDRVILTPTLVTIDHGSSPRGSSSAAAPLPTTTTENRHAIVAPVLAQMSHGEGKAGTKRRGRPAHPVEETIPTVTGSNDFGLAAATLVQTGYGEREGQAARVPGIEKPIGTLVAGAAKHALVEAFISRSFGEVPGKWKGAGSADIEAPLSTITTQDHNNIAAVALATFRGTGPTQPGAASVDEPLGVISAGGIHAAEVRAFLVKYYGTAIGQVVLEPVATVTAKDRLGLVTVEGVQYEIVDIGLRMLEPHELLKAQFGKYATRYDLSFA